MPRITHIVMQAEKGESLQHVLTEARRAARMNEHDDATVTVSFNDRVLTVRANSSIDAMLFEYYGKTGVQEA